MLKTCIICGNEFETRYTRANKCSEECKAEYRRRKQKEYNSKKPNKHENDPEAIPCKICGRKMHDLSGHIIQSHKMPIKDYKSKYGEDTLIISEKERKRRSEKIKGENNPAYQHGGKFSPFSDKFIYADKVDKEELYKRVGESNKNNGNNKLTLKYWTSRGYTEEQANEEISKLQSTFSLEKCIEKYGEIEGTKRWKERQEKWQETLNSKEPEEIERISRAKMCNGRGYSKISQDLFWKIFKHIKDKYENIYFATLNPETKLFDESNNHFHEYFYISENGNKYFFDFYVKDIKKIIEFDGDYWHGEARGNQERDRQRDEELIKSGFEILHIKERDYKNKQNEIIQECLNYLIT